jgi:hypothetical protein
MMNACLTADRVRNKESLFIVIAQYLIENKHRKAVFLKQTEYLLVSVKVIE